MNDPTPLDPTGAVPGRRVRRDEDATATQRIVVGDDSRIREVGGTRDARRDGYGTAGHGGGDPEASADPHARGDTVERPALLDDALARGDRRRGSVAGQVDHADHVDEADGDDGSDAADGAVEARADHGAHPVAVPLAGFFSGMVYVLALPVLWFALSDPSSIGDLLSADLIFFAPAILIPVVLALVPRTRRFGRYMLLGALLSGVVVVGVAAIVLSFLIFTGA